MQSSPSYSLSILSCFYTEMDENRKLPIIPNSKHLVYEDEMDILYEGATINNLQDKGIQLRFYCVIFLEPLYIYSLIPFRRIISSNIFIKKRKRKKKQSLLNLHWLWESSLTSTSSCLFLFSQVSNLKLLYLCLVL